MYFINHEEDDLFHPLPSSRHLKLPTWSVAVDDTEQLIFPHRLVIICHFAGFFFPRVSSRGSHLFIPILGPASFTGVKSGRR